MCVQIAVKQVFCIIYVNNMVYITYVYVHDIYYSIRHKNSAFYL
jgi:hypothetical protein